MLGFLSEKDQWLTDIILLSLFINNDNLDTIYSMLIGDTEGFLTMLWNLRHGRPATYIVHVASTQHIVEQ